MFRSLIRVIKFGFKNFWRNIWMSFATTLIMVLTLFSISLLVVLNFFGNMAMDAVKNKIDVTVFIKEDVSEAQITQLQGALTGMNDVKEVRYISKDQALNDFKKKHGDNPLIISSVEELEGNPLRASLIVKADNPENYVNISNFLDLEKNKLIIEKVNYDDNKEIINKISSAMSTLKKIGIGVSAVFCLIAIMVMFNTIRMTIYTQKDEIGIMRLVGATNKFIEIPFVIEGILYGILASLIATALLYPLVIFMSPKINEFLDISGSSAVDLINNNILIIIGIQMLFGIFLGVVSSLIAIRKHLKV